ncbi:MAG: DEAD/DEAH box helicase [Candidatus Thermoplasmatota archaeon]|nr:DEAD/DEAH box helicase [Candidatus Thermoplasmatota archaeon]
MDFDSFELHPTIRSGVDRLGYVTATPIQEQGIPLVLSGRDVIGLAQTGTGKTAAFVLPILQRLSEQPRGTRTKSKIRALVLAPTRELAEQTYECFVALGSRTNLRFITIYGGVKQGPQLDKIERGVDIVVACPGRLLDLLNQKAIDLSTVEIIVLDEADRMFDMGFLPDVRRIMKQVPRKRQTLLFSATMPDEILKLSRELLYDPATLQIDHTMPLDTVSHALYPVPQHLKTSLLLSVLETMDANSILIFTRTKHRAKRLGKQLGDARYAATSLQGNLSQNQRKMALDGFRKGKFQILVATDIAARGLDISTISHVINYDIPDTPDAYTHRIGRTGRAAKTGDAFTFVTEEDEPIVRSIERVIGAKIERRTIEGFDYLKPVPPRASGQRTPNKSQGHKQSGSGGQHGQSHGPRKHGQPHGQKRHKPKQGGQPHGQKHEKSGPKRSQYHRR